MRRKGAITIIGVFAVIFLVALQARGQDAATRVYQEGNSTYRSFVDNKKFLSLTGIYKIEDTTHLIIYSQPGIYKTSKTIFYYFSTSMDSPIRRLTTKNLKRMNQDPSVLRDVRQHRSGILTSF